MSLASASSPLSPPAHAPAYASDPRAKKERARASAALANGWNPFTEPGPGPFFSPPNYTAREGALVMFDQPAGWADWVFQHQNALRALPKAPDANASLPHVFNFSETRDIVNLLDAFLGCGFDPNALWRDELALSGASEPVARVLISHGANPSLSSQTKGSIWTNWALRVAFQVSPERLLDWIEAQGAAPRFTGALSAQLAHRTLFEPPTEAFFERLSKAAAEDRLGFFNLDSPANICEAITYAFLRSNTLGAQGIPAARSLARKALARIESLVGFPAILEAMDTPPASTGNMERLSRAQVLLITGNAPLAQELMDRGWAQTPESLTRSLLEPTVELALNQAAFLANTGSALAWLARRLEPSSKPLALSAWRAYASLGPNAKPLALALLSRNWLPVSGPDSIAELFPNGWAQDQNAFGALLAKAEAKLISERPRSKKSPSVSASSLSKPRL